MDTARHFLIMLKQSINFWNHNFPHKSLNHNFPHKLLLTNTQILRLLKVFGNGWSANRKLSKAQFSKMIQSGLVVILARNAAPELAEKATEYYVNKGINRGKYRGILFKRTRKITSQEDGFINFLRPLMTAGLPLMKNILHH